MTHAPAAATPSMSSESSPVAVMQDLPQGLVRLEDWGVIRARGEDAASFLQGQLTQDVTSLTSTQARLAGYCTAKGRLMATFVMWRRGDDILLACSADLLAATLKRLSMFVMRARCKLSDASAEVPLWGLAGDAEAGWPAEAGGAAAWADGEVLRLPDAVWQGQRRARFLLASNPAQAGLQRSALAAEGWRGLEVASATPRIVAATVEAFVPQMVNLELVQGVNFKKGCYPGQEVVARSQYRGTLKRRSYVMSAEVALAPGQEVFHGADPEQPAGRVVNVGVLGAVPVALVELKMAALESGRLHLGSATGPVLQLRELPYPLPSEAAE